MATLKGSETHENLKRAFAGEAEANRRYIYFARQADIEGYPEIAGLVPRYGRGRNRARQRASWTSSRSRRSGHRPADRLNAQEPRIGDRRRDTGIYRQYPQMAADGPRGRFPEIADWFETLATAEKNHAARFTKGLKSIRT